MPKPSGVPHTDGCDNGGAQDNGDHSGRQYRYRVGHLRARARVIATILDRVKKGKPIFHEVIEPQE